jgi:2-octaprenylphenol hydroxylase
MSEPFNEPMKVESDVLIVGAGLVGLSLAAALSRSHLSVTIVDARARPLPVSTIAKSREDYQLKSGRTPRVSSINPSSREFLSRMGAWEMIPENRISTFKEMSVWDNRGTSHIEFGDAGEDSPALGHIVENQLIEIALIGVLEASNNVTFEWQSDLQEIVHQGSGYAVHFVNGGKAECSLLVGADGGNSRVRELCGLRTVRWSYQQTALVTTVETELDHGRTARQCFTNNGPLAFLPLADQRLCSIVWSVNHADELMGLEDQQFCELLTASFENRLGSVLAVDKRFTFPLVQQHALQYVDEQVVLIGDAAHTIHPLAGQGANLGFADANVLAQVLAGARLEGKFIGETSVLKLYQRRRQAENIVMASAMEFFKRLYDTDNPGVNWVRNAGMRLVNNNDRIKSMISRLAAGS